MMNGDYGVESLELCEDLANWMSKLPNTLRSVPVIHLAIPGSHDSATCTITRHSPVSPDTSPVLRQLSKIFGTLVKRLVYNWVVTQRSSIREQLNYGIRYLDLRIATKPHTRTLFFVHGLYGEEINDILNDVKMFLENHPKEVMILDFQHFYAFTENDHNNLMGLIHTALGKYLCPIPVNLYHVTLNWMHSKGYQLIVIYRNKAVTHILDFWPSDAWPTPWPETINANDMLHFNTQRMALRPRNAGFVTQCVLTPDGALICRNPFSTLEQKCAVVCNSASIPWLKEQFPGNGGVNVVILDFIDYNNTCFCKTVIELNRKLLTLSTHKHSDHSEVQLTK